MTNNTCNIAVVVVLYQQTVEQSLSLTTLRQHESHLGAYQLIVYNNSADYKAVLPHAIVENASTNNGLAKAYNRALALAQQHGCKWLMLLDQDTSLTADYLEQVSAFVERADSSRYVVAVPRLIENGVQLSPTCYKPSRGVVWRQKTVISLVDVPSKQVVTAFNSATLVNVDMLLAMGGFDETYPLDMLDHRMFWLFHEKHLSIAFLPVSLAHSLSENSVMETSRYKSYLEAHRRWAASLGWRTLFNFKFRMALRWAQQILLQEDIVKRRATFRILFK
ncbi:MAG: glycosyltransferase [Bacteroidales bacterium]|nr:glycosyltransferase [Bacteroidales bacterium]